MPTFITKYANFNNLKMVDARKSLVIHLIQADIKKGRRKNPTCCAFSLACRREDPGIKAAYFFKTTAWLEYDKKLVRYVLPSSVQKELVSFDRARIMVSGDYQLTRPARLSRLGTSKRKNVKKARSKILVRRVHHVTKMVRELPRLP